MIIIIICNDNDYQYQNVAPDATKKCIWANKMSVYDRLWKLDMAENKSTILLEDVSIDGDLIEKDKMILNAKVSGDIKADVLETHSKSNIEGNVTTKSTSLGGKLKGNVNSDNIKIRSTANIEGVLNQKTLSIEKGASLKIKTETYK